MHEHDRLDTLRHSMAHVMAEAVLELFPGTQIAIGPAIENGFYYDFDLPRPLVNEDLETITEKMKAIIARNLAFENITRSEARELFKDQVYKLELLDAIEESEEVSIYSLGEFTDLCRGLTSNRRRSSEAMHSLMNIAGAYWRGKETNPMLTRIYGTAWFNAKELRLYMQHLEDVKSATTASSVATWISSVFMKKPAGFLVYWHPNGARIRQEIENFWRAEHYANGYEMVYTPHIGKSWLWETSGHLGFYKEGMYPSMEMDNADYYIKPMNCPFHIMIYNNSKRSYRDLPFRWAELGTVYRYEKAGTMHGLLRVRGFTQDDAHLFVTPDQMEEEIAEVLRFSLSMLKSFGFSDIAAYLSTRPEKAVGDPKRWDDATEALRRAIEKEGLSYEVDEGGGAFYGPKIDLKIKDAIGREWQLSTVQFDFNEPERFDMTFVDRDGTEKRPYMIHRALLGSLERFFGVLIEHYAGAFPPWLAPEQIKVIPVSDAYDEYAERRFKIEKQA